MNAYFGYVAFIALLGVVYWRAIRGWRTVRAFSFSTSQKWLAVMGWLAYCLALPLWLFVLGLAFLGWLGSLNRVGPDDSFMASVMVTVIALPVSLFLAGMTSTAFGAIEELEGNKTPANGGGPVT